ncbi:MAG TPA: glycosyltransferase family A protein [Nitrospiraceae bacterium]|nr:glycosyltransferase family A protein [Nitrospiraceae bacterium]
MSRSATVSVVIPVYNAREVIGETIRSVLAQTWKEIEIVVVDDGSTDGSEEVIRPLGDRIKYVRQENGGVAKARNRGIAESSGPYVALLDHDDLWDPTKLEKQVSVLERHPKIGMVVTDVARMDRTGSPIGLIGAGYDPSDTFARLFVQGYIPTPSAAMIRRTVFGAVGGFDEAFHAAGLDDHEFWTRVAAHCDIANIPEALTYHREFTAKPAHIALKHRVLLISRLMSRFGDDPAKRRYLLREEAAYFSDYGKQLIRDGYRKEGRSHLIRGLILSLGKARSLKTGWRCVSRIARSYVA